MPIAVAITVAIALANRDLELKVLARLRGERLAQHLEVSILHPIAKKPVGRLDGRNFSPEPEKVQRADPRFVANLS